MNKKILILILLLFMTQYSQSDSNRKMFIKKITKREINKIPSNWDIFIEALIRVESEGKENAVGTKNDVGVLQITPIFVQEVNRILKKKIYTLKNRRNKKKSIEMFNVLQARYNPTKDINKAIKLHNPRASKSYHTKIIKQIEMIKTNLTMTKQQILDIKYLKMAKVWSENSYAIRRKVGCLIVKNNSIISDGYNGTPSGFENVCENIVRLDGTITFTSKLEEVLNYLKYCRKDEENLISKPYVLHAEANAITKLAKSAQNCERGTCYITDSPCLECSKLIIQSGIKRVVYCREYRNNEGMDILKRANIEVIKVNI